MNNNILEQFLRILDDNSLFYNHPFSEAEIHLFIRYYKLVLKWNNKLHLTTLTSPSDFAERHLLESAFAAQCVSPNIQFIWDIGSGLGIPGIPFAALYPNLSVNLIESNQKKAIFLKELACDLGLPNVQVINQRFESLNIVEKKSCIITRALENLNKSIPAIIDLGQSGSQILFLGNNQLQGIIKSNVNNNWKLQYFLIPQTIDRQVISLVRFT